MSDLAARIRAVADPLIAAGASNEQVRTEVLRQTGIGIGGGGGHGGSEPAGEPCPYCGATGGGGHGGMCPNSELMR